MGIASPSETLAKVREALELAYETLDDADGSSYHVDGDACLTPGAQRDRSKAMATIKAALALLPKA